MSARAAGGAPGARDSRARATWRNLAPLVLAIGSLLGLMAALFALQRRTDVLRAELATVGDARAHLNGFQTGLAREMSAQRGYLLFEDTSFVQDEKEGRAEEVTTARGLEPLALGLGPGTTAAYDTLRERAEEWHRFPGDAASLRGRPPAQVRALLVQRERVFERVLEAGGALEGALKGVEDRGVARLSDLDRVRMLLAVGLLAVALASVLGLARVARRLGALHEQALALAAEAERRRLALEEVAEEKGRFLRGVAHDLKNPLGAIDAYAQLLEAGVRGPMPDEQLVFVGRIRRVTQECVGIIQDLLHLAKAEARQLRIDRRATDLAQLVHETADDYRAAVDAGGFTLHLSLADDLDAVHTDGRRVREILGNLLSNALKHTPPGGRMEVRLEERRERGGTWVALEVVDSGAGIPADERERIFAEFHRLRPEQVHGSGIGLAISRQIARLLGGDLTVGGEPGRGAVFTLWLPRGAVGAAEPASRALAGR